MARTHPALPATRFTCGSSCVSEEPNSKSTVQHVRLEDAKICAARHHLLSPPLSTQIPAMPRSACMLSCYYSDDDQSCCLLVLLLRRRLLTATTETATTTTKPAAATATLAIAMLQNCDDEVVVSSPIPVTNARTSNAATFVAVNYQLRRPMTTMVRPWNSKCDQPRLSFEREY